MGGGRCGPRRRKASAEAWKCENSLILRNQRRVEGLGSKVPDVSGRRGMRR